MADKFPLKFDTSELELAARQVAVQCGKDVPAYFNKKMGWLLRRWLWETKKADYAKMARSLGLSLKLHRSGEKVTKTGKRIKFKGGWKARNKTVGDSPLIVKIIAAELRNKGKPSPFKGVTRRQGARAMARLVKKKFSARARSIAYLRSGIASALKPFLPDSASKGLPPDPQAKQVGRPKGFGTRATPARNLAVAVNKTTTKRKGSQGLEKVSRPALEKAYRAELADTREQLNKVLYDAARKAGASARL